MPVNMQQVQALLDLSVSSSSNGVSIPINYGTSSVRANLIWSTPIQEVITTVGVKDTNDVTHNVNLFSYTASFAAAFCEGSTAFPGLISKIWGDSLVLYDNTATYVDFVGVYAPNTVYLVGEIVRYNSGEGGDRYFICVKSSLPKTTPAPSSNNPFWQITTQPITAGNQQFPSPTLYTGADDQEIDPTILAALGPEVASAYRGMCYAVWTNLDLTKFNNKIPSIRGLVQSGNSQNNPSLGGQPGSTTSGVDYIVTDICERSGMDASIIDASDLEEVVTTAADVYQTDGSGIPALTLLQGGMVYFYQEPSGEGHHPGAPWEYGYQGVDGPAHGPLQSLKYSYPMKDTETIVFNPYPADSSYAYLGYTSFLQGWTPLDSYNLLPMEIVGVQSGGAGPATWNGTSTAPFTPANVGDFGQANWNMVVIAKMQIAVAGDYTFKCSQNGAVIIGMGNGATRVSGPMTSANGSAGPAYIPSVTALKGLPVMMCYNVDPGENNNHAQPFLDSILSTFVVNFPTAGTYSIEVDFGCHVRARCLCLNWVMNGAQSPLLPIGGTDGADPITPAFGYQITDQKDGKSVIDELVAAYFFDCAESDFKLKFVRRGVHAPVMTISEDNLGLVADKCKIDETLTQLQDAPLIVTATYLDPSIDYQQGSQQKRRSSRAVASRNQTTIDLKMAMSQTLARAIAEKTLFTTWMERQPYAFNLWRSFFALLDPTDVVEFVYEGVTYQERLMANTIGQNLALKMDGVNQLAAAYASTAQGAAPVGVVAAVVFPFLLLEDGGYLLWEDGGRISIS